MQQTESPVKEIVVDEATGRVEVIFADHVSNRCMKRICRYMSGERYVEQVTRIKHVIKAKVKSNIGNVSVVVFDLIVSAINSGKRMSQQLLPDQPVTVAVAITSGSGNTLTGSSPRQKPSFRKMRFNKRTGPTRSQKLLTQQRREARLELQRESR